MEFPEELVGVEAHIEGKGFVLDGTMILRIVEGLSRHTLHVCEEGHLLGGRSWTIGKVASGSIWFYLLCSH
jgi:hypothetical protein